MSTPATQSTALNGKTCLVTGGAGGLGKAIATAFLQAGAHVLVVDVNEERVKQTETDLAGSGPGSLTAFTADITSLEAMEKLFSDIGAKFSKLDILINNAAIMDRFEPVGDLDVALWNKVLAVNLTAPAILSKLALGSMLQGQQEGRPPQAVGHIINIASGAAKAGWLAGTAYTASKHGLVGLTKSTAAFYGDKGIRCNVLTLGVMPETNINDAFKTGIHPEGRQKVGEILSGLRPTPCNLDDVAALCVSLTSGPAGNAVNGAVIAVDHGWTSVVG